MESALQSVADVFGHGYSYKHLEYVFVILLAYPISFTFRYLPAGSIWRHLLSASTGLTCGYILYGKSMHHTLMLSLLTYTIARFFKHKSMPFLVLVLALGHLSFNHLCKLFSDDQHGFDYIGAQMVLVFKLTSYAFNIYDGYNFSEKLPLELRQRAILQTPSLLEFLGYAYFCGSFFAGPAHCFMEYKHAADDTLLSRGKNPSTVYPSMKRMLMAFACLPGLFLSGRMPMKLATTEAFWDLSFAQRFWYIQISSTLQRFQYYFVWKLTEGSCIAAGLGYRHLPNGEDNWNSIENVDITGFEFAPNFKALIDSWNKGANNWLRFYVYWRLAPPPSKPTPLTTVLTYLISAIWHGFYPGFYLTFMSGAFCTVVARVLRQRVRPWVLWLAGSSKVGSTFKMLYDILGWLATMIAINYIVVSFIVPDKFIDSFKVFQAVYFCIHIAALSIYCVVINFVPKLRTQVESD